MVFEKKIQNSKFSNVMRNFVRKIFKIRNFGSIFQNFGTKDIKDVKKIKRKIERICFKFEKKIDS